MRSGKSYSARLPVDGNSADAGSAAGGEAAPGSATAGDGMGGGAGAFKTGESASRVDRSGSFTPERRGSGGRTARGGSGAASEATGTAGGLAWAATSTGA